MLVLALDTSSLVASAAVVSGGKTLGEVTLNIGKTHSQTIMPLVDYVLKMVGMDVCDMDYIAVTNGPGSFTGLRIGGACAKALAHGAQLRGVNVPMVPVPTLDALAYNIFDQNRYIVPVMDARRNQVYTAIYRWDGNRPKPLASYEATPLESLLESVKALDREAVFTGDGLEAYRGQIQSYSAGFHIAPVNHGAQRAASVGALALLLAQEGMVCSYKDFTMVYLRKPQAEREYEAKKTGESND